MPDIPTDAFVRLYRIQRQMSTVSLATHAGITVRYLEMIEAGSKTPSVPVFRKLAKVLGVRTSALVGEPPSENYEGPVNPRLAEVERALFTYRSLALGAVVSDRAMRYAEETEDPLLIAAATWSLGHAMRSDDMPAGSLEVAVKGREALEPLLPDGTPELFSLYGGLLCGNQLTKLPCGLVRATTTTRRYSGRPMWLSTWSVSR
ncbi:MAG TPA: helix-turn-helix transcriptional regulator [Pseudonocardiaceae bacterium]|nr:helix-turn-helix transcriptional regulator [Pseudonocardiaceae bacterium]